jgi:cytochrome P450
MLVSDHPLHKELRRVFSSTFDLVTLRGWKTALREIVKQFLNNVKNEFDVIGSLTLSLPLIVISKLLGIFPISKEVRASTRFPI